MIAEFLCIINFGCGLEESLILRVKDKQGWVEWSWASAASHGGLCPEPMSNSHRQRGHYILLGSEIWPENVRDGNVILARPEANSWEL
jgi:hypothetical protein